MTEKNRHKVESPCNELGFFRRSKERERENRESLRSFFAAGCYADFLFTLQILRGKEEDTRTNMDSVLAFTASSLLPLSIAPHTYLRYRKEGNVKTH